MLEPGMDWKNGKFYMTIPRFRVVWTKQKKDDIEVPTTEYGAAVISSDKEEGMWTYDRENAYERGFAFPSTFMVNTEGWGSPAADRWLTDDDLNIEAFDLYQRVRRVYETHIQFADEMYNDLMSLYVIATYVYKLFEAFPYIHFGGTKASGKSQNLRILQVLGFNATLSAHMTPADMFRTIAGNPGLMCIDEAENFRSERGEALLELLRSGYKKGVTVSRQRQKPDGTFVPDKFNVYGPKALASIAPLDSTTASRSIKVAMEPALRSIPEFKVDPTPHRALIDDLHFFALANAVHINEVNNRWTLEHRQAKAPGLNNRAWELSGPLVVMADYIGSDMLVEPLIEWLTNYFEQEQKRDDTADNIRTLAVVLPTVLKDHGAFPGCYYSLKDILTTYREYAGEDVTEKVTTKTIARYMDPIGFKDTKVAKGGKQVRIEEAALRHVFSTRRVTPKDEDVAWFHGTEDYQWFLAEEQEETASIEWGAA